jgi:hypothetical protein
VLYPFKILTVIFRKYPYSTFHFCFAFKMSQVRISTGRSVTVIETCHGFTLCLHLNSTAVPYYRAQPGSPAYHLPSLPISFLFPRRYSSSYFALLFLSLFSRHYQSDLINRRLFCLNWEPNSKHCLETSLLFKQPVTVGCLCSCTSKEAIITSVLFELRTKF